MSAYTNPVYQHECADPFVLKFKGEYWCYRTGACDDGRIFGILHSPDLVHWEMVDSAMDPLPEKVEHYWAPEVFYDNGRFFLYYAAGIGPHFHLRVAIATQPQGPFIDSGRSLTQDPFAIDAHVFEDEDGQRYLFYAVDFLDHPRAGTGTVMDRMFDPLTLAGNPRPVSRARFDWQIFDPNRAEKGGLRWHTIEGSFTLKHKGRYYQMFSGGNYQNPSYGVSYAVTPSLDRPGEWDQFIDGETSLPILRTVPGKVNGPGHNSVVRGPDNRQNYCIYHVIKAQERFERILAIDPLEWVGDRLTVLGPSYAPQPAPILPVSVRRLDDATGKVQSLPNGEFHLSAQDDQPATARINAAGPAFLLEANLRCLVPGSSSLELTSDGKTIIEFTLAAGGKSAAVRLTGQEELYRQSLPAEFDPAAVHLLRVEADFQCCQISLDHAAFRWEGMLDAPVNDIAFSARQGSLELEAIQITRGFEERFEPGWDLESKNWHTSPTASAEVANGLLALRPGRGETTVVSKPLAFQDGEFVANLALQPEGGCALVFLGSDGKTNRLILTMGGLIWQSGAKENLNLDATPFMPGRLEQIRVRKIGAEVTVMRAQALLGTVSWAENWFQIQIEAYSAGVDLELVRFTEIEA